MKVYTRILKAMLGVASRDDSRPVITSFGRGAETVATTNTHVIVWVGRLIHTMYYTYKGAPPEGEHRLVGTKPDDALRIIKDAEEAAKGKARLNVQVDTSAFLPPDGEQVLFPNASRVAPKDEDLAPMVYYDADYLIALARIAKACILEDDRQTPYVGLAAHGTGELRPSAVVMGAMYNDRDVVYGAIQPLAVEGLHKYVGAVVA